MIFIITWIIFCFTPIKSEIVLWLRIQELFLLDSLQAYRIIGLIVIVGFIGNQFINTLKIKDIYSMKNNFSLKIILFQLGILLEIHYLV